MKAIFSIMTLAALTFAAGIAVADGDLPVFGETRDVGAQLYAEAFGGADTSVICVKDFSAPVIPSARIDAEELGTLAYNDTTIHLNLFAYNEGMGVVPDVGERSMKGSAAGGICPETAIKDDARTVIWDHLMGAPGGSDLP